VFCSLVAAGLGVPIPEELPIVGAGAAAGTVEEPRPGPADVAGLLAAAPAAGPAAGLPWAALYRCANPEHDPNSFRIRWWIILPLCILGVVFSDGLLYGMGRFFGRRVLQIRWMARLMPPNKLERIEQNFHHYGVGILLFARFLPGIRAPIFITAGIMRLPLSRFLLADGLYAIPGVTLLFTLAFWFTNSFKDLVEQAEAHIKPILIIVAIVAVAIYLLIHFLRKPVSEGDPEELPIIGPQVAPHMEAREDACPNAAPVTRPVLPGEASDGEVRRQARDAEPRP
jgi:membrane protein DedA with SNARE-associated domain